MMFNDQDKMEFAAAGEELSSNIGVMGRVIPPQFALYKNIGQDLAMHGPLGAAARMPGQMFAAQTMETGLVTTAYGMSFYNMFAKTGALSKMVSFGSKGMAINPIKLPGMWGTRHIQAPFMNTISGLTRRVPILGDLTKGYADFALGNEVNPGNWLFKKMGGSERLMNKYGAQIMGSDAMKGAMSGMNSKNAFVRLSNILKIDPSKSIAPFEKEMGTKVSARMIKSMGAMKTLAAASTAVSIGLGVFTAVDLATKVGGAMASAIRLGANYTEFISKQSTKFLDRARNVEMGGDLSSFMTQAAVTERTRALQFMQNARVNGAYMYGNETNYL